MPRPTSGISLSITVPADVPTGRIALVGARIVTMADAQGGIIDDGVILIDGNRITAVGRRGQVAIPADARTVDVTGKTIIPGLIDGHAHGPQGEDDLIPQQNWSAMSHLAMGVTTVHDPSSTASEIFPAAEMQRAGIVLAPRTFSSGEIVYGAREPSRYALIDNYQDALAHVRRLVAQGAHSIKNYNQPRRNQRQQVVAAARAENILVVPEGGSLFQMDITLIQDGNSTLEHNIPQRALLRGRAQPLVADPGRQQPDPDRLLWRPCRRSLLDAGDRRSGTIPCSPGTRRRRCSPRGCAATTAPADQFVDQYNAARIAPAGAARRADRDRRPRPAARHRRPLGIVEPRPRRRDADRGAAPRHRRSGADVRLHRHRQRSSPASSPISSSSTPIRRWTSATPTISTR